jgi:hypothetical protein
MPAGQLCIRYNLGASRIVAASRRSCRCPMRQVTRLHWYLIKLGVHAQSAVQAFPSRLTASSVAELARPSSAPVMRFEHRDLQRFRYQARAQNRRDRASRPRVCHSQDKKLRQAYRARSSVQTDVAIRARRSAAVSGLTRTSPPGRSRRRIVTRRTVRHGHGRRRADG